MWSGFLRDLATGVGLGRGDSRIFDNCTGAVFWGDRVSLQSTTTRARLGLGSFVVTNCEKYSGVALGFHSGPWFSLCPDTWMVLRCLDAASSIPTGLLGHPAGGVPSSPSSSGIAGSPVSPPAPCPDGTGGGVGLELWRGGALFLDWPRFPSSGGFPTVGLRLFLPSW